MGVTLAGAPAVYGVLCPGGRAGVDTDGAALARCACDGS